MKNRKGFTLVELLAVIAILAILVIIALPNVMGMFNDAKKNSFTTELKNIYKVAQQQWMTDSMLTTGEQTYSRCKTCTGKSLQLSGRTELDYYIKIDKSGKVVKYYATDGTYQFSYDGDLLATQINNVEEVAGLEDDEIIKITNGGAYTGDGPKLVETVEQDREGVISIGDEVIIGGTEHFNVVSTDSSKTKLLAKYNLYVGYNVRYEDGYGYRLLGQISSSENGYGMQSSLTTQKGVAVVPFSAKNYWQSTTNPNYFNENYPDGRNLSVYNKNASTVAPNVSEFTNAYNYTQPNASENDYTIAYYVEPYINRIKAMGVTVYDGGLLSNNEAASLGCSGNTSCSTYSNTWVTNTNYWVASVAWEGSASYQSRIKTVGTNRSYSYTDYNSVTGFGVRPTITINTSDIPLLPHSYFENKPVIIH